MNKREGEYKLDVKVCGVFRQKNRESNSVIFLTEPNTYIRDYFRW